MLSFLPFRRYWPEVICRLRRPGQLYYVKSAEWEGRGTWRLSRDSSTFALWIGIWSIAASSDSSTEQRELHEALIGGLQGDQQPL